MNDFVLDLKKNEKPLLSAVAYKGRLYLRLIGAEASVVLIAPGSLAMPAHYRNLEEVAKLDGAQSIYQGQRGEVVF